MFIRQKTVKGHVYYSVIESYRDDNGKVRHRTCTSLGRNPTVEDALREAEERYLALSRDGKDEAATEVWRDFETLEMSLRRMQRTNRVEGPRYERSAAMTAEGKKRDKAKAREQEARRAVLKAQREREQRVHAEFMRVLSGGRGMSNTAFSYHLLGLNPPITLDQLKEAYRRKSREYHPDHGGTEGMMFGVNQAYETLQHTEGGQGSDKATL